MVDPRNTISIRWHLDERADVVEQINNDLLDQGLIDIKASKSHIPLVTALKQTPSDKQIDLVLARLCPTLEKIGNGIEYFDIHFPGLGTFYHSGGKRDNCVLFLEPRVTPEMRKIHSQVHSIVEVAISGTNAEIDKYTHPDFYSPHVTIAKRVKRDSFSEVVRQVNQWALDGPFDLPEGNNTVMTASVTCLALKIKNFKGTGETKIFEYNLKLK
mmetsp:Transcript_16298/g.20167  ORF Transcript_16298/g.20167 Transcript_16298/m.20167 type:complete len:214 (-) Transcript_16298:1106-1747(-)